MRTNASSPFLFREIDANKTMRGYKNVCSYVDSDDSRIINFGAYLKDNWENVFFLI